MGLSVRERPPLGLSVCVTPPAGGPPYLWTPQSQDPAYSPDDLTFATSLPGGFSTFSCTLNRDRRMPWPDEQEFAMVTVLGLGGRTVAWQGRLEQLPDQQGYQAQVNPHASGWQSHLDDDDSASVVFIDQRLSQWGDPSVTRQIALTSANQPLQSSSVGSDPTSGAPALIQTVTGAWASGLQPVCESWYDAGSGDLIAKVYYHVSDSNVGGSWSDSVSISTDANASSVQSTGNLIGGSGAGYAAPATPERFAFAQHFWTATGGGGTAGNPYNAYWYNLAVYGNHGLTGKGPDPVGFLASDMIGYSLGRWCPKLAYTTGANGTIQASSFVIPQAVFSTPTTASTIIKQLASYELLDWAVYELGRGPAAQPAFYLAPFNASPFARSWRARVGPAQLQDNGPNVSRIWNSVIVQYTDVSGVTQTVGPPGSGAWTTSTLLQDTDPLNPANQAGLKRWALVQAGTSTAAAAIQTGSVFLQAQKELDSSGQASLVGHVMDISGVWWPAWCVRAGDSIAFIDASDTSPRRIVSTSYEHSTRTNTIQLDQPPDAMDALLARLGLVISPAGFSG